MFDVVNNNIKIYIRITHIIIIKTIYLCIDVANPKQMHTFLLSLVNARFTSVYEQHWFSLDIQGSVIAASMATKRLSLGTA